MESAMIHAKSVLLLASIYTEISAFACPRADTAELPAPQILTVATAASAGEAEKVAKAARTYAAFWNTGDPLLADAALSSDFQDRALPEGRAQGKAGPIAASKAFRAAVPDLTATIEELIVAGDRAVVRLAFAGHFTGRFGALAGDGEPVFFRAIDIYRVTGGKIAENWHLEDNLTLMKQLGAVK
jgi:predicted ester cyclase